MTRSILPFLTATSALCAIGCGDPKLDDAHSEAIDERVDWSGEHPGATAFYTPDYEVPAYSDQTMCYFDTYQGGDAGIVWAGFYQNLVYGHHVVLMASTADEDDWPDGTVSDCTDTDADIMVDARPFLFASDLTGSLQPEMNLPAAMAVKLKAGQRFVIQSHHINTGPDPVLVNDAVFLEPVDVATVETWAAPWVHTQTDLNLPEGHSTEIVDCTFDTDLHLLSVLGHLHEWGAAYKIEHVSADGATTENVYDIPEWDVQFRDAPPVNTYETGSFEVKAGDHFVTTCEWDNDTGKTLTFPYEMCATVGFAYPLIAPIICEP